MKHYISADQDNINQSKFGNHTNSADGMKPSKPQLSPILHTIEDLQEPLVQSESCRMLANARVIWANYDLIQQDFADINFDSSLPHVESPPQGPHPLPESPRPDIDAWLLRHGAVISETQLQYTITSEKIEAFGPVRVAYRPPRYGRALVVQLADSWPDSAYRGSNRPPPGLLDVKGCGVAVGRVPELKLHRR